MHKKYFFFDIDGTLTSTKIHSMVPDNTQEALHKLQENGHFVAIATGRPYYFAHEFASRLNIDNMVCNGGNDLYVDGVCIHHESFDRELALEAIHQCLEKDISFCVSIDNTPRRLTHNTHFLRDLNGHEYRGELEIIEDLNYDDIPSFERVFIAIRKEDEHQLAVFQKQMPSRYHEEYLILEPDDKYQGIDRLIKMINAPKGDIVVFGDGSNDIKMFQQAPFSIAMGNGITQLKELADFVTKSSDDDGISFALKQFGWI